MKYDIIILAGQSNAEGRGYGEVEEELTPLPNVWYLEAEKALEFLENDIRITYADKPFLILPAQERICENGDIMGNFSLTFADRYIAEDLLEKDRDLLIVRASVVGTGFKKEQWGVGKLLYNKLVEMVDYALSLHPDNRIVATLWHQGEHDVTEKNIPDVFKTQLTAMLVDMRNRYGKDIPFIAGDFVYEWKDKNFDDCQPILKKIKEVIDENDNTAFVETAGLLSNNQKIGNGDDVHFCRDSLHKLGRRYFVAYQKVLAERINKN